MVSATAPRHSPPARINCPPPLIPGNSTATAAPAGPSGPVTLGTTSKPSAPRTSSSTSPTRISSTSTRSAGSGSTAVTRRSKPTALFGPAGVPPTASSTSTEGFSSIGILLPSAQTAVAEAELRTAARSQGQLGCVALVQCRDVDEAAERISEELVRVDAGVQARGAVGGAQPERDLVERRAGRCQRQLQAQGADLEADGPGTGAQAGIPRRPLHPDVGARHRSRC